MTGVRAPARTPGETGRSGSCAPTLRAAVSAERADLVGLRTLGPLSDLELHPLVLLQRAVAGRLDRREVGEDVGAATILGDEAVALLRVEPLDRAGRHLPSPSRAACSARNAGVPDRRRDHTDCAVQDTPRSPDTTDACGACSTGVPWNQDCYARDASRISSSGGTGRGPARRRSARRPAPARRHRGTSPRSRDRAAAAAARTRSSACPAG